MLRDALYALIKDWIEGNSGLQAIPADDNGPKPDKTFFTFRLDSFNQIGFADISSPDEITELVTIKSNEDFTCEIQCFGNGAMDKSRELRDTLQLPSIQDLFMDSGVSVWDWLTIQNISGLDESEIEERSSFDMMLRLLNSKENIDLGIIKNVEGTGKIEKPDGTDQIINLEINTP